MSAASISPRARLDANVVVGDGAIIYPDVEIGAGSVIGPYCIIGHPAPGDHAGKPLRIAEGALIRSHSIIYEGSDYGPNLRIGHHSLVREGIRAGTNFQAGSFCDLEGLTDIGDWVRFHSSVHIGRGTKIGDFVLFFPYTVTTNDPAPPSRLMIGSTIRSGVVVATSSVVLPGTVAGEGVFIGAMTRAVGNIPAGALYVGNPGQVAGSVRRVRYDPAGITHPWPRQQAADYPAEAQDRLTSLLERIEQACDQLERPPAS